MLVTPMLMAVVSLLHPLPPFFGGGIFEFLRSRMDVWMGVHLVQLPLFGLLGLVLWFLTEGLEGPAATTSRLALVSFLVFYSAFDSAVGIATGLLVQQVP
jgi:hypothetical protein